MRLLVREAALLGVLAALWIVELGWADRSGSGYTTFAILVGLVSTLVGALLHEWGHLVGSLLSRSVVHFPPGWIAKLLFDFDVEQNDRRQFLWMSLGGYVGSALGVLTFLALLPHDRLAGQVALGGAALGMLVSVVVEMPTTIRVLRGAPPPPPLVSARSNQDPQG